MHTIYDVYRVEVQNDMQQSYFFVQKATLKCKYPLFPLASHMQKFVYARLANTLCCMSVSNQNGCIFSMKW